MSSSRKDYGPPGTISVFVRQSHTRKVIHISFLFTSHPKIPMYNVYAIHNIVVFSTSFWWNRFQRHDGHGINFLSTGVPSAPMELLFLINYFSPIPAHIYYGIFPPCFPFYFLFFPFSLLCSNYGHWFLLVALLHFLWPHICISVMVPRDDGLLGFLFSLLGLSRFGEEA